MNAIGIDIGSTCAKAAVADEQGGLLCTLALPTGWSSVDTAEVLRQKLLEAGYDPAVHPCVATGYGRVAVPYAGRTVTEITCHARGACSLFGLRDLTVIDIGGQDTKIIAVKDGMVQDFLMNDKCSAGTGRFLEVMANTLAVTPGDLCRLARQGGGVAISSMCTVFADSEVVSLVAQNKALPDIVHGLNRSVAARAAALFRRVKGGPVCMMTGGVARNAGVVSALEEALGLPLFIHEDSQLCGALGAALFALEM